MLCGDPIFAKLRAEHAKGEAMTGYSGSPEEDHDYAMREAEHEPPIEMILSEEELDTSHLVNLSGATDESRKPLASVALSREDSDYLRVKLAAMYDAIDLFIAESAAYSSKVHRMLIKGDGEAVIRFMLEQQVERTLSVQRLGNVLIADWRHALLMSLDMTPEHLAHWLPEYAEQLGQKGETSDA